MNHPMHIDIPLFRGFSGQLAEDGTAGAAAANDAVNGFPSGTGNSPFGANLGVRLAGLHGDLALAPPQLDSGATNTNNDAQNGLNNIESRDQTNGQVVRSDKNPADPDQQAKDLQGQDKYMQIIEQLLQEAGQTGGQIFQQIGQQFSQIGQQGGQLVQQATQQISGLLSKGGEAATTGAEHAAETAAAGLGAATGGAGAGGAGLGMTVPAGLEEPVTPMTTSSALTSSAIPPAAAAQPPTPATGRSMPMMPMMPMAHRGSKEDGASVKRDPVIFPESKIYDPPKGTEQNFGANPEIEAEEPPFGTAKA